MLGWALYYLRAWRKWWVLRAHMTYWVRILHLSSPSPSHIFLCTFKNWRITWARYVDEERPPHHFRVLRIVILCQDHAVGRICTAREVKEESEECNSSHDSHVVLRRRCAHDDKIIAWLFWNHCLNSLKGAVSLSSKFCICILPLWEKRRKLADQEEYQTH